MHYRTLLVDDEPFMREALRNLLPWSDHGFELAGEASNGADACSAVDSTHIDLVITDIKMPRMDGLALIEHIGKCSPSTIAVVLSAYDEFHLVKESFKLGVEDYILKSELDAEEVAALLAKVKGRLDRAADASDVWNRFVMAPGGGVAGATALGDASLRSVRALHLDCEVSGEFLSHLTRETQSCVDEGLFGGFVLQREERGYTAILGRLIDGARSSAEHSSLFDELFDRLSRIVRDRLGCEAAGGLSTDAAPDPGSAFESELTRVTTEAREACAYSYFRGRGRLIRYQSLHTGQRQSFADEGRVARLRRLLDTQDMRGLAAAAADLCVPNKVYDPASIESIKALFQRYYYALAEFVAASPFARSEESGRRLAEFADSLRDPAVLAVHNKRFRAVIEEVAHQGDGAGRLVRRAAGYIHEHYAEDFSLAAVSRHLGVSKAYLSRVFSQEMGEHFVGYLAKVRMEQAAKLLARSDLKIYEIAERVGYPNPEHFSRTFKKVMGTSPTRYLRA